MRALLIFLIAMACAPSAAQDVKTYVPAGAYALLPELVTTQREHWADAPMPSFLAAQIEQESCISLKHSKCWSPNAQLKTSREWGFGLNQTTIRYNQDGSVRFNTQQELRRQYASLAGWTDDKKFDASYQLLAVVEMDHGIFRRISNAASERDRLAFMLSGYNGGESGVRQDRLLCSNTLGCDSRIWFEHVERHSLKTRKANPGYGQSAYDINRGYVRNVLDLRRPKYEKYFSDAVK